MKYSVSAWQMGGFVVTSILGTFLHFLFDLTGGSVAAALISAVNESIWEHMKLLYYPMILLALVEYRVWGRETASFWCIKLRGILLGLMLIPVLYYTYTGILGVSADWFNITIFFIAAAVAFRSETKCFRKGGSCKVPDKAAVSVLCLISALFTVLTFLPPHIPFFADPLTGTYGYWAQHPG